MDETKDSELIREELFEELKWVKKELAEVKD